MRLLKLLLILFVVITMAANANAQTKLGPSFDCGSKVATTQPLAQMICANDDLSYWELAYELWSKVGDGVDQEGGISWG